MVGNVQKGTQHHGMIRDPESTYLQCGFIIDIKRNSTVVIQKTADFLNRLSETDEQNVRTDEIINLLTKHPP